MRLTKTAKFDPAKHGQSRRGYLHIFPFGRKHNGKRAGLVLKKTRRGIMNRNTAGFQANFVQKLAGKFDVIPPVEKRPRGSKTGSQGAREAPCSTQRALVAPQ